MRILQEVHNHLKIFMLVECPGLTRADGSTRWTALFTAIAASANPDAISPSLHNARHGRGVPHNSHYDIPGAGVRPLPEPAPGASPRCDLIPLASPHRMPRRAP